MNNDFTAAYAEVNGLKMYYEIHGEGEPLVLVHGGGSTIQTSFAKIIPLLAKRRQIIAVELQAHGRTNDRDTGLSFEQDADDIAALLQQLKISKVDILGFSNGGQTVIEICLRHSPLLNKAIIASAFYNRAGVVPQFWDGFENATIDMMPKQLHEDFLQVNNDAAALQKMFDRDVQRMKTFKGWTDEQMQSIQTAVLVINGNNDVGCVEHAVEMYRVIPNAELLILPGGHGDYFVEGERPCIVDLLEIFLDKT